MEDGDIKVNDFILKGTTKCEKDFSCLSSDKECLCKVVSSNKSSCVELEQRPVDSCNYSFHFNASMYCLCPTRNEIYNRYKK
jgi:hypothetical protein